MQVNFEIVERIAIIGKRSGGWNLELNLVKWNGNEAKYDLRGWNEDHSRSGKGLTMTKEEITTLCGTLEGII